jgi:hypothetical protein
VDQDDQNTAVELFCFINAVVYFVALLYLGATVWRAALIGILVLAAALMHLGRTVLLRGGVVIIVVSLALWAGVTPQTWLLLAAR